MRTQFWVGNVKGTACFGYPGTDRDGRIKVILRNTIWSGRYMYFTVWNTTYVYQRIDEISITSGLHSWIKIDQLMSLALFFAQRVSNASTFIFRSLRLCVGLWLGCDCGWGGVVSLCRLKLASAYICKTVWMAWLMLAVNSARSM